MELLIFFLNKELICFEIDLILGYFLPNSKLTDAKAFPAGVAHDLSQTHIIHVPRIAR